MSRVQEMNMNFFEQIHQPNIKTELINLAQRIRNAASNGHPVAAEDIDSFHRVLKSIEQKYGTDRVLANEVRDWIIASTGVFYSVDLSRELNLTSRVDKQNLSKILERLSKDHKNPLIVKHGDKRGCFRILDNTAETLDWFNADPNKVMPLKWPFALETLVHIYPGNVIVVAGEKSAGKTALLLNLVRMNIDNPDVPPFTYFCSEFNKEELRLRLGKFPDYHLEKFLKCDFRKKTSNFADSIVPDNINIIDYMKLTGEFYNVGDLIFKIYEKLKNGLAIIALQKKKNERLARGGDFSLEEAKLYLSMAPGKLTIIEGKNWVDPKINPVNKIFQFSLWEGCKFIQKGGWQAGDDHVGR